MQYDHKVMTHPQIDQPHFHNLFCHTSRWFKDTNTWNYY